MTDYKKNRHSVYKLQYHLVVVTKYRKNCITKALLERLKEISFNLFEKWNAEIVEINEETDHIHILFEVPPQVQLSKLINNFKTVSSRYIQKEFQDDLKTFYCKPYFLE